MTGQQAVQPFGFRTGYNMRDELDQETVQITRPRLIYTDRQGYDGYYLRTENYPIATESDDQVAEMARLAIRVADARFPRDARVAHIGGGFCILPRILDLRPWGAQDIYEIEPALIRKAQNRWPNKPWRFVEGDWRATLAGQYDIIVYHINSTQEDLSDNDRDRLTMHLAAGGVLLGG
jgi:hypothetical protein